MCSKTTNSLGCQMRTVIQWSVGVLRYLRVQRLSVQSCNDATSYYSAMRDGGHMKGDHREEMLMARCNYQGRVLNRIDPGALLCQSDAHYPMVPVPSSPTLQEVCPYMCSTRTWYRSEVQLTPETLSDTCRQHQELIASTTDDRGARDCSWVVMMIWW